MEAAVGTGIEQLYLDLLKKALTHTLYRTTDTGPFPGRNPVTRGVLAALKRRGIVPLRLVESAEKTRDLGHDWPIFAQTMVGRRRLDSLQACVESAITDGVPGDLIETGVWRGGSSIFMRGVLRAHGVADRTVWVADSFRGLPPPRPDLYPADAGAGFHEADDLAIPLEEVQANFERYGLLDEQVRFLEGWFSETLPTVADRTWAVIRLDGDLYESTVDALGNLYDGLSPGGYAIIDDYSIESCRKAVGDYRTEHGIDAPIQHIDETGVFWRKPL